jgi:hypothetical protein
MTLARRLTEKDLAAAVCALLAAGDHATALALAGELRARLDAPTPISTSDARVTELEAENASLRAELAKERRNARVRQRRRELAGQEQLFERAERAVESPVEKHVSKHVTDVSLSLSDLNQFEREKEKTRAPRAPATCTHDPSHPADWAIAMWREHRPTLAECFFRRCWERFARKTVAHASEAMAKRHFRAWLFGEDCRPLERAPVDDEQRVELPPISGFRPVMDARPRPAAEARLHAVGQTLALLALEESTGPPVSAPGGA